MKYFNYILFFVLLGVFCSCNTIEGPAPEGALIDDPETESLSLNAKAAVNHMVVSLVIKCQPIANAGKDKPEIINNFVLSAGQVNHLQMAVWNRLRKMNMILSVSDMAAKPEFKLTSEITRLPERENGKKKYSWIMALSKTASGKEIWNEQVDFVE